MPSLISQSNYMTDSAHRKKEGEVYDEPDITWFTNKYGFQQGTINKKTGGDPDDPSGDSGGGYPYPVYNSPTAGAQYSYGGTRPTWSWDQAEPTYSWDREAPVYTWDDSVRPGEFTWDDSKKPGEFSYKDAPTYDSRYDPQIQALAQSILNREAFSYDYTKDPLYAQYADAYGRNGRNAMQDTLAQVSARTGGLASSYAGTAAQNTYNQYMQALNDKIPELQQIAYEMYRNEGADMRNNLSMLQGMENMDYGKYQDLLSQYNTDRNLAYNQWATGLDQYNNDRNFAYQQNQDAWNRYYNDRNFNYGQYQDALSQYNTDRNFSYGQYQDALGQYNTNRNFSYGTYADALSQYNNDRNFDYNVWQDNLSRQEAAAKAAYNSEVAAYNASQKKSGGSSENSSSEPVDIYGGLYSGGAKDTGTAYAMLIAAGYSASVAKELANYYGNTYYPGLKQGGSTAGSATGSASGNGKTNNGGQKSGYDTVADISKIYSGGNSMTIKGPGGQSYTLDLTNSNSMSSVLDKIANLNVSPERKQELANQLQQLYYEAANSKYFQRGN